MTYTSHRAVPYGVPANTIDRIIIQKELYTDEVILSMKDMIKKRGLDIKIYDMNGNLL